MDELLKELLAPLRREEWMEISSHPSELLDRIVAEATTNEVWVTMHKVEIPVKSMTTSHIHNCVKCFNGQGRSHIPAGYLGGIDKWLTIFHNELIRRS